MSVRDKIYFASDFHLGCWLGARAFRHEKKVTDWLDSIKKDALELYLIGDVFDYWFEYKEVIPKGHARFLGKIAELSDGGVKIFMLAGNHDMWVRDYYKKAFDIDFESSFLQKEILGKKFFIHHGDGLGDNDKNYKMLKKFIYKNKFLEFLYRNLHPDLGIKIMRWFSSLSRKKEKELSIDNVEQDYVCRFCLEQLKKGHIDYFIFGHRHSIIDVQLTEKSRYINLSDWIDEHAGSYVVFDKNGINIKRIE